MKNKIHFKELYIIVILFLFFFTSCSPSYYMPTKQQVRVFEKKGDIIASVNFQPVYHQLGIEAGYAITDNIGINSSYNRFDASLYGKETNLFVKDFLWDNELILYKNFKFGLFGAANFGYGHGGFNACNPYYRLSMDRFFAQPSIGYLFFSTWGIGFSTRFTQSNYNLKMFTSGYSEIEQQMIMSYFELSDLDKSRFFIEPALTLFTQVKASTFKLQFIHSYTDKKYIGYDNWVFSYSLNLSNLLFRDKKIK